jgi:glycolate oxidase FAD binding subunit
MSAVPISARADSAQAEIVARVRDAAARKTPLEIRGGGSKRFYGQRVEGEVLSVAALTGITDYEPSELVLTALGGTPLTEIEAALATQGQMLPFEPPHFLGNATLGGAIAAGLAGPRRAALNSYYGGVRDFVLGTRVIDGQGQVLDVGGKVMKNVAGYDLARVMAGSLGTLGVIAQVSLKVLPLPVASSTLQLEVGDADKAIELLNQWGGQPLPITASAFFEGALSVRLEGARAAVQSAARKLGGELVQPSEAQAFWHALRDHTHGFFAAAAPLWRLSLPSAATLSLQGETLIEWGGALRWWRGALAADDLRARVSAVGGHATLFRANDAFKAGTSVFTPLDAVTARIHTNLKRSLDPQGIFNRGRLYAEF